MAGEVAFGVLCWTVQCWKEGQPLLLGQDGETDVRTKRTMMTDDGLNGILPAVKYRVPARHVRTHGNVAVFVLPAQFASYMKQASVRSSPALRDADLNEIGKVTRFEVIQDVTTIHVELAPGRSVPGVQLQASFKINKKRSADAYYLLQSIYPETLRQQ